MICSLKLRQEKAKIKFILASQLMQIIACLTIERDIVSNSYTRTFLVKNWLCLKQGITLKLGIVSYAGLFIYLF
jgi:hypothetical protein